MPCQSHKPGDECEDVCARSCYARKDGMSNELLRVARLIEDLKRPCGMDPESATAIQNGRYMSIAYMVRALAASAAPALEERATAGVLACVNDQGEKV
jgi:hypothetical protein